MRSDVRRKLEAQLEAAQEAIDTLRGENASLYSAARDVLRFHDDCICRHARRFLKAAVEPPDPVGTWPRRPAE